MESDFRIAVIGLGLIGGSLAYALKGTETQLLSVVTLTRKPVRLR